MTDSPYERRTGDVNKMVGKKGYRGRVGTLRTKKIGPDTEMKRKRTCGANNISKVTCRAAGIIICFLAAVNNVSWMPYLNPQHLKIESFAGTNPPQSVLSR